ncbi:MAG TPA: hypothetical protein VNM22_05595 [Candidatus Limnocylindrales bacterium]|nr:hypothetical protein [Candidatus Limnocylindrales bacterium]
MFVRPKLLMRLGLLILGGLFLIPSLTLAQSVTVTVPANVPWTDTGITVTTGQILDFRATGAWSFDPKGSGMHGPDGVKSVSQAGPGFPFPSQPPGILLLKVGNHIRAVGSSAELKMTESGKLFLGINDSGVSDNQGAVVVTIKTKAGRMIGPTPSSTATTPLPQSTTSTVGTGYAQSSVLAQSPQSVTIQVPANVPWTDTGISVIAGQVFDIRATGTWSFDPVGSGMHGPDGVKTVSRAGSSFPLPVQPPGILLAKVGNQIRPVGSATELTMPGSGELFLGINDSGVEDNQGVLTVTITPRGSSTLTQTANPPSPTTQTITIHVQDQNKTPLAGYWVWVYSGPTSNPEKWGDTQTDRQGNATFNLPNGSYRVYVSRNSRGTDQLAEQAFSVPTGEGGGNQLTVTIATTALKSIPSSQPPQPQVTAPTSQPSQPSTALSVHLQDRKKRPLAGYGITVYAVPGGQKVAEGQTDAQGNLTLTLPNGTYKAIVTQGNKQVMEHNFKVPNPKGRNQFTVTLK